MILKTKFLDTLSIERKQNFSGVIDCMNYNNITNTMMQVEILAAVSKESSFIPKLEKRETNLKDQFRFHIGEEEFRKMSYRNVKEFLHSNLYPFGEE